MSDTENRCSLSAFKACTLSSAFITNDTLLLLPPYEIIRTGISFNALMMCASKPTFYHSKSPTTQTITIFFSTVIVAYSLNTPTISSMCLSLSIATETPISEVVTMSTGVL